MSECEAVRPKYILVGGFLGAGKTTAIARLARHLADRGLRVGIISNDQSTGLVDTATLRGYGFHVEEIAGGCFCCRFDALLEASNKLRADYAPEVFLAEPVGSCTDLVATVSYPLRRMHGERFAIAPLSVLVDPVRAARVLGIEQGPTFSEKVVYVYRKQLEEADFIVVNKCDLVEGSLRERLVSRLEREFPRGEVLCCSARDGRGLGEWFKRLVDAECKESATMELDYERYGEGEALLGWLNCTVKLRATTPLDGDALLMKMAGAFREKLRGQDGEIAHLKMTLVEADPTALGAPASSVSLVGSDAEPELSTARSDPIGRGILIINLRGEADPEVLRRVTERVLEECVRSEGKTTAEVEHLECFRPAKPSPTHRVVVTG